MLSTTYVMSLQIAANRFQCAGSIRGSEAVKNDGFASLRALADLQKIKLLYGL